VWDVVKSFRIRNIKPLRSQNSNNLSMALFNYLQFILINFRIVLRSLMLNKTYSLINIFCLTLGMSVSMLTALWVYDEATFDQNHPNYERISQVMTTVNLNNTLRSMPWMPYHLDDVVRQRYGDDYKYVVMANPIASATLVSDGQRGNFMGSFMGNQVLSMLDAEMISGSHEALDEPYSIVLSKTAAMALFGRLDPIGKIVTFNDSELMVTGVFEDLPANSTFHELSYIIPWNFVLSRYPQIKIPDPWKNASFLTYVQLKDNVDLKSASSRIQSLRQDEMSDNEAHNLQQTFFLHPMSKWHLYSNFENGKIVGGRIETVGIFAVSALFVLILAIINFVNLATAQAQQRSKGIGIRKVLGAGKAYLFFQHLTEYIILVCVSLFVSVIVAYFALIPVNTISQKSLELPIDTPSFWLIVIAFCSGVCLLAGAYPAIYLSSLNLSKSIKGVFKSGNLASAQRRLLVVIQFSMSTMLIVGTVFIYRQIEFAKNRDIGYKPSMLVAAGSPPEINKSIAAFKDEVTSTGAVVDIAQTSDRLTKWWSSSSEFDWRDKDPETTVVIPISYVSPNFGKTVEWTIMEGRDFLPSENSDSLSFIINESAAKYMGFDSPVGEVIKWREKSFKVVGVIKDMIIESPYENVRPYIYHRARKTFPSVNVFRLNPERMVEGIQQIHRVYEKFVPEKVVSLDFVDEEYFKKFQEEERISSLISLFSFVAITLSCIGMFGLAKFVMACRMKEVAIRKILGSDFAGLWKLLSKDFAVLSIISTILAAPLSYYLINSWLQNYSVRVEVSLWSFLLVAIALLALAISVVSISIVKTINTNPVEILATE
jgi:putative ABC transport system permease protein